MNFCPFTAAINRFHTKYIKQPNGCWEWQGYKNKDGYGKLWYMNTMVEAHRFSFELLKKENIRGLLVCHKCDNPGCVNPDHLFTGTNQDNSNDKREKDRHVDVRCIGTDNVHSKLTEAQVQEIRILGTKFKTKQLAEIYKLYPSTINRIKKGKIWSHLPWPSEEEIKNFLLEVNL